MHTMTNIEDLNKNLTVVEALQSIDRHDEAMRRLKEAEEAFPEDVRIKFALAFSCKKSGLYDEAIDHLLQANARFPKNFLIYIEFGRVYLLLSDYESASEALHKSLALKPDSSNALTLLSAVQHSSGDHIGGADSAKRALELEPSHAGAMRLLALCVIQNGCKQQAMDAARHALEIEPENAMSHSVHAYIAFRVRSYGEAKSAYAQALALDPNNVSSLVWRYNMLIADAMYSKPFKKYGEVLSLFASAIEACPHSSLAIWLRGTFYLQNRRLRNALIDFERAKKCKDFTLIMKRSYNKFVLVCGAVLASFAAFMIGGGILCAFAETVRNLLEQQICLIFGLSCIFCPLPILYRYFRN
jgi:tetratricopeptide (TPR) repeat protein